MIFTSRSYAIGQAHFQIAGGLRSLGLLVAGYIAVASSLLGILFYNAPTPLPPRMLPGLATFVMVVEAFVLVVFGSIRVGGSIRSDTTSNMIESHRLMPVPAWRAVLGYLFGTNAHVLAVTVLNFILLLGLRLQMTLAFEDFIIGQIVLGIFALFVWSFSAMGALMLRQMMPLLILGFVFGSVGSVLLRENGILPGLSMLSSPFLGETIFSLTGGGISIRGAYSVALTGEIAFGVLFFIGACRRYRGTYPATFNVPQGLALGLVWALLSVVSIVNWKLYVGPAFPRVTPATIPEQVVAALAIASLLALVPLHGLVVYQKRKAWPGALVAAVLAGTVGIAMLNVIPFHWYKVPMELMPAVPLPEDVLGTMPAGGVAVPVAVMVTPPMGKMVLVTLLVVAAHVMTMYQAFRATRKMTGMSTGVFVAALLFFVWVGPFLVELVRAIMLLKTRGETHFSVVGTLSPLGLLIDRWTAERPISAVPGLLFQWLVAIGVWQMARRIDRAKPTAGDVGAVSPAPIRMTA